MKAWIGCSSTYSYGINFADYITNILMYHFSSSCFSLHETIKQNIFLFVTMFDNISHWWGPSFTSKSSKECNVAEPLWKTCITFLNRTGNIWMMELCCANLSGFLSNTTRFSSLDWNSFLIVSPETKFALPWGTVIPSPVSKYYQNLMQSSENRMKW